MKNLKIFKTSEGFSAGSNVSVDEMHNLHGSIFDLWSSASDLLRTDNQDQPVFRFQEFEFCNGEYLAEWNDNLDGYVITFDDGKIAQTQIYVESNRLHADYNETYLERYTEYDNDLSAHQDKLVNGFVSQVNKLKLHYG